MLYAAAALLVEAAAELPAQPPADWALTAAAADSTAACLLLRHPLGFLAAARCCEEWLSCLRADVCDEALAQIVAAHFKALCSSGSGSGSGSGSSAPAAAQEASDGLLEAALAAITAPARGAQEEEEEEEEAEGGQQDSALEALCESVREALQKAGLCTPGDLAAMHESLVFGALQSEGLATVPAAGSASAGKLWVRPYDAKQLVLRAQAFIRVHSTSWMAEVRSS
jgi:hypothetical protein